jgi:hypothetical protein
MSRKKLRFDRKARLCLEIQPTVSKFASLEKFGLWSILVSFLCAEVMPSSL